MSFRTWFESHIDPHAYETMQEELDRTVNVPAYEAAGMKFPHLSLPGSADAQFAFNQDLLRRVKKHEGWDTRGRVLRVLGSTVGFPLSMTMYAVISNFVCDTFLNPRWGGGIMGGMPEWLPDGESIWAAAFIVTTVVGFLAGIRSVRFAGPLPGVEWPKRSDCYLKVVEKWEPRGDMKEP